MPRNLFVAWQDSRTRSWHTVARLTRINDEYELVFTEGARRFKSVLNDLFGLDLEYRYRFQKLIPAFRNKIPPKSRSDYASLSNWFGVSEEEDEFTKLSKFGMLQSNEPIIVYPEPDAAGGRYECEFFLHALRYMHPDAMDWCRAAAAGAVLNPLLDVKNEADEFAVALRSTPGCILLGYIPAFFARDINLLLRQREIAAEATISVVQANPGAPAQMMLRCKYSSPRPEGFSPLGSESHQLLAV